MPAVCCVALLHCRQCRVPLPLETGRVPACIRLCAVLGGKALVRRQQAGGGDNEDEDDEDDEGDDDDYYASEGEVGWAGWPHLPPPGSAQSFCSFLAGACMLAYQSFLSVISRYPSPCAGPSLYKQRGGRADGARSALSAQTIADLETAVMSGAK